MGDDWDDLPLLLTVEEAGRLLRVGRSHAYNQVTLYFASCGTDGIPLFDLEACCASKAGALRTGHQPTDMTPARRLTSAGRPTSSVHDIVSAGPIEVRPSVVLCQSATILSVAVECHSGGSAALTPIGLRSP